MQVYKNNHDRGAVYKYFGVTFFWLLKKITSMLAYRECIACICFEIGVCPWPDLSALFQYTSPTPVVSLHLIPRIQYYPGIPVTLLTGSSCLQNKHIPLKKMITRTTCKAVNCFSNVARVKYSIVTSHLHLHLLLLRW